MRVFPDLVHPDGHRRNPAEALLHHRLLAWDIRPGENVLIIGGYYGATIQWILDWYPEAEIYTADPQPVCVDFLRERFAGHSNVHIVPGALGVADGVFPMTRVGSDAASFVLEEAPGSFGEMREFGAVMEWLGIRELAWLHMNIEQYEYLLLPHLMKTGWLTKIGQLAIATHTYPWDNPDAQPWPVIQQGIEQTHEFMWSGGPEAHRWWGYSLPGRRVRDTRAELAAVGVTLPETDDWE